MTSPDPASLDLAVTPAQRAVILAWAKHGAVGWAEDIAALCRDSEKLEARVEALTAESDGWRQRYMELVKAQIGDYHDMQSTAHTVASLHEQADKQAAIQAALVAALKAAHQQMMAVLGLVTHPEHRATIERAIEQVEAALARVAAGGGAE